MAKNITTSKYQHGNSIKVHWQTKNAIHSSPGQTRSKLNDLIDG